MKKLKSQDSIRSNYDSVTMWTPFFPSQNKNVFMICESTTVFLPFVLFFIPSSIWGYRSKTLLFILLKNNSKFNIVILSNAS